MMNIQFSEEDIKNIMESEVLIAKIDIICLNLYKWMTCDKKRKLIVLNSGDTILDPFINTSWKEQVNKQIEKQTHIPSVLDYNIGDYFFLIDYTNTHIQLCMYEGCGRYYQNLCIKIEDFNQFVSDNILKVYKYKSYKKEIERIRLLNAIHGYIITNELQSKSPFINQIIKEFNFTEYRYMYF